MSVLAIVFAAGTVINFFGLVILPCLLFIVLVFLVFIELLGDISLNLTSGKVCDVVGEL